MSDAEHESPGHVFATSEIEIVRDLNTIEARSLLDAGCVATVIFTPFCILAFGFVSLGMYMLIAVFLQPFQWSILGVIPFAGMWIAIGSFFILGVADNFYLSRRPGRYCLIYEPGVGWFLRRLVLAPKFIGPRINVSMKRRRVGQGDVIHWIAVQGNRKKPSPFGNALTPMKKRERLALESWMGCQIEEIEQEYSGG